MGPSYAGLPAEVDALSQSQPFPEGDSSVPVVFYFLQLCQMVAMRQCGRDTKEQLNCKGVGYEATHAFVRRLRHFA